MKKTQMIHSPRTFKVGLGLMLAASMASMPVLTGASERQEAKAAAASKKLTETEERDRKTKNQPQPDPQPMAMATPTKGKTSAKTEADKSKRRAGNTSAEDRARERTAKLELEAKKIADGLSPSQRTKLLALINDSNSGELAAIRGIGKSRSAAIEKARPIESIEDLPKIRGVGLKTLADVVDHGMGLTTPNKAAPKRTKSKSDTPEAPEGADPPDPVATASEA